MTEREMAAVFLICLLPLLGIFYLLVTMLSGGRSVRMRTSGNGRVRMARATVHRGRVVNTAARSSQKRFLQKQQPTGPGATLCQWCGKPVASHVNGSACLQRLDRVVEASLAARRQRTRRALEDVRRLDEFVERVKDLRGVER